MALDHLASYDESRVLPFYLNKNYGWLFSRDEWRAIGVLVMRARIARCPDPDQPAPHYVEALAENETPEARSLLADGADEFWRRASERILHEHRGSILINRCPRCGCIVESPAARQCLWCHFDWHPRHVSDEAAVRARGRQGALRVEPADPEGRGLPVPAPGPASATDRMVFFAGPGCALCGEPAGDRPQLMLNARADAFPAGHPLEKFRGACMHWDCYEQWPERLPFARACVTAEASALSHNEYVGLALHDEHVCVGVIKNESVIVWLMETGTCLFLPLSDWAAWLSDLTLGIGDQHRVAIVSVEKALPELRRRFPTMESLLAAVDWDAKERLVATREEERIRQAHVQRDALRAHNEACQQFFREHGPHGLTCPHCWNSTDIEFLDRSRHNDPSCFVCPACARSFGYDL